MDADVGRFVRQPIEAVPRQSHDAGRFGGLSLGGALVAGDEVDLAQELTRADRGERERTVGSLAADRDLARLDEIQVGVRRALLEE